MDNKGLLRKARSEILRLRDENRLLAAQVGVIEVFAMAMGMRRGNNGAEVDVAWELQQEIDAKGETNG